MTAASPLCDVRALTFDFFGTVLDLHGSLAPAISECLQRHDSAVTPGQFWERWRHRQRIEQYQDNIVALGHSGYLATARRALVYTLALCDVSVESAEIDQLMAAWQQLSPFDDVAEALVRLSDHYQLVGLSNGEPDFLQHLATNRIRHDFDQIISVQEVGAFKPDPGVYRRAAGLLGLEPGACLMVSANSFDVMGARMCGFRGAFVNRSELPYEDSPYRPDLEVSDFTEMANRLLSS
ncbi:MAG: haloacid dehalogenase type II [Planctomycetaceae bacterium]